MILLQIAIILHRRDIAQPKHRINLATTFFIHIIAFVFAQLFRNDGIQWKHHPLPPICIPKNQPIHFHITILLLLAYLESSPVSQFNTEGGVEKWTEIMFYYRIGRFSIYCVSGCVWVGMHHRSSLEYEYPNHLKICMV